MAQAWAKRFYNSKAWKEKRIYILTRDRYRCTEPGCKRTAEEVHHIIELTESNINNLNIALGENNLRSLCSECHKKITKAMKTKDLKILEAIVFDENGYPILEQTPQGVD